MRGAVALMRLLARLRRVTSTGMYDARLDGLRTLAILPVLFFHASLRAGRIVDSGQAVSTEWWTDLVPRGSAGVMLFFFISGFIIAFPYFRAADGNGRVPTLGWFYKRRAMRLMPAYFIALTGAFLVLQISRYAPADAPKFNAISTPLPISYLVSLLYQHNMVFGVSSRILPPIWTLEVEIQFYLFAPFLLAAYARAPRARRRIALLAIIFLSLVANACILPTPSEESRLDLSVLGYLHFFLAGILAGDIMFGRQAAPKSWGDPLLICGYAMLLYSSTIHSTSLPRAFAHDWGMFAGVVATYCGAMVGKHSGRLLSATAFLGGACYSIYLTHLPIIQAWSEIVRRVAPPSDIFQSWLLMSPSILIALIVGLLFYAAIEQPTMKVDWPQRLVAALRRDRNFESASL